jgi:hypothetical protein
MPIHPPMEIPLGSKAPAEIATVGVPDISAAQAGWMFNVMQGAGAPATQRAACLRGSGMSG